MGYYTPMKNFPIQQIAYFVPDVRVAARQHHEAFGSGPYFVAENIPLAISRHRGVDTPCDHSSAYGQWGDIMIEFVQQNNTGPSAFHDMYPENSGRKGIHHVAIFVDDVKTSIKEFENNGHELAFYAEMNSGFAFAFMDTVALHGHMTELYSPDEELLGFYTMVKQAKDNWPHADIIHTIAFD